MEQLMPWMLIARWALAALLAGGAGGWFANDAVGNPLHNPDASLDMCVLAHNSVADSNVTGTGTQITVDFDSEVHDRGGNFASDTFTAPVDGRYNIATSIRYTGATEGTVDSFVIRVTTSNRTYQINESSTDNLSGTRNVNAVVMGADMDASDTLTIVFDMSGEASDVVDIHGHASNMVTYVSVCAAN